MTLKLQTTTNERSMYKANALAAESKLEKATQKYQNLWTKYERANAKNESLIQLLEKLKIEQSMQSQKQVRLQGGNIGMRGGGGKRPLNQGTANSMAGRMTHNPEMAQ